MLITEVIDKLAISLQGLIDKHYENTGCEIRARHTRKGIKLEIKTVLTYPRIKQNDVQ